MTQVMDVNLQPYVDLQHLVLEWKIYEKSSKCIHDMVFNHSRHMENLAEEALNLHFRDLNIIWTEENDIFNIFHKYFATKITRDPTFHHRQLWPQHNLELVFSVYDFSGYKTIMVEPTMQRQAR